MKKSIIATTFLLITLIITGCGEIDVAEELPPEDGFTGENIDDVSDDLFTNQVESTDETETDSDDIIDTSSSDEACEVSLEASEEKADACIADLEAANQKIENLQLALEESESTVGAQIDTQDLNQFYVDIFQNVPQKEFPFDTCGRIPVFTGRSWYNSFEEKLTEKKIFLEVADRPINADDFFGGCSSDEGGIAFFLGAGRRNQTEFHLVKYDYENDTLEKAIIAQGSCDDCPGDFGKRRGGYIELFGDNGTQYRYYFDRNVLIQEADFE